MEKEFIQMGKQRMIKSWEIIIPYHLCFLLISFLGLGDYLKEKNLFWGLLFNECYHIVLIGIIFFVMKDYLAKMWRSFKNNGAKTNTKGILFGIFIIFVMNFGYRIVTTICFGKISIGQNQTIINEYITDYPVMTFMLSVFLGTFTEEILYRGIIFQTLRQRGKVCACLGSALLFGFIHIISSITNGSYDFKTIIVILFNYVIMGLAFAIIFEKYRNIYINYFVHMAWNAVASGMAILMIYLNSVIK